MRKKKKKNTWLVPSASLCRSLHALNPNCLTLECVGSHVSNQTTYLHRSQQRRVVRRKTLQMFEPFCFLPIPSNTQPQYCTKIWERGIAKMNFSGGARESSRRSNSLGRRDKYAGVEMISSFNFDLLYLSNFYVKFFCALAWQPVIMSVSPPNKVVTIFWFMG